MWSQIVHLWNCLRYYRQSAWANSVLLLPHLCLSRSVKMGVPRWQMSTDSLSCCLASVRRSLQVSDKDSGQLCHIWLCALNHHPLPSFHFFPGSSELFMLRVASHIRLMNHKPLKLKVKKTQWLVIYSLIRIFSRVCASQSFTKFWFLFFF